MWKLKTETGQACATRVSAQVLSSALLSALKSKVIDEQTKNL